MQVLIFIESDDDNDDDYKKYENDLKIAIQNSLKGIFCLNIHRYNYMIISIGFDFDSLITFFFTNELFRNY